MLALTTCFSYGFLATEGETGDCIGGDPTGELLLGGVNDLLGDLSVGDK